MITAVSIVTIVVVFIICMTVFNVINLKYEQAEGIRKDALTKEFIEKGYVQKVVKSEPYLRKYDDASDPVYRCKDPVVIWTKLGENEEVQDEGEKLPVTDL